MILALDAGNTNIVLGGLEGEETLFLERLAADPRQTAAEYAALLKSLLELHGLEAGSVERAVISSVVPPLDRVLAQAVRLLCGKESLVVGPDMETGLRIATDDPDELGADLIAAAAAALEKYPLPQILLDLGTATTLSVLDREGVFRGVVICPGVKVSFGALSAAAAQLPELPFGEPGKVIGTNSPECMQSGILYGHAAMLDGLIDRIEEELGERCVRVATGGLSGRIVPYCRREILMDEDLVMDGLRILYEKNSG